MKKLNVFNGLFNKLKCYHQQVFLILQITARRGKNEGIFYLGLAALRSALFLISSPGISMIFVCILSGIVYH